MILLLILILEISNTTIQGMDVLLCGPRTFELLEASSRFSIPSSMKDHVVALPIMNERINIRIFENDTSIFQPIRCFLRLETCPNCIFNMKLRNPIEVLNEQDLKVCYAFCSDEGQFIVSVVTINRQVARARENITNRGQLKGVIKIPSCYKSFLDPCFDLRFIEDGAGTTLDLVYQNLSIWDFPFRNELNSSSNSITFILTVWNTNPNSTLNHVMETIFPLLVTSYSNEEIITGSSSNVVPNKSGYIESPCYPSVYPRSIEKNYSLINQNPKGFVRLIFDDFQIHFQSGLQIFDSDGLELINTKKKNRRPPAIISSRNQLTIQFKAHDFTQMVGFRARYEFVDDHDWAKKPNSKDCDGFLEGYGGILRMDGMMHLSNTYVDCIWIVKRLPHFTWNFDRIYLKVEDYRLKGIDLRLEIREGASSVSDLVLVLFDSQTKDQLEHKQPRHGFVTSLSVPEFYIRLRGYLMSTNGLEIIYSQFYYWATSICSDISEFHCDNARCIKATLRCNNVNNCGDASDEQCQRPSNEFRQSKSDLSGLIALVVGVCGLIILLISTTAVMGRYYRRRLSTQFRTNESTSSPNSSSEATPAMRTVGERRFYVVPENHISVIEAPPSYCDALKHPAVPSMQSSISANQGLTSIPEVK